MKPRLRDVAEAAGVSTGLVSYALNDRPGVAPATKAHILDVARRLGYEADPHARAMRTGRTGTVGLVVRSLQNPYFNDVIMGAQEAAFARSTSVLVIDSAFSPERERRHIRRLAAQKADGLGICPINAADSVALWRTLRPGTPVVMLNAANPAEHDAVHVTADRRRAIGLALRHLVELGHRRIAFMSPSARVLEDHERRDLFLEQAQGLAIEPTIVETAMSAESTYDETLALLARHREVTALIANSDFAAHAIYEAARAVGVRIGVDLSLVGQDDLPTSKLLAPSLTTIRIDRRAVGRALFERLTGPADLGDHRAPVELVVRDSTGPPRAVSR